MIVQDSITRQLKIDMITDVPNPIIVWFNKYWKNLKVIQTDVYHNNGGEFIYYIINPSYKGSIQVMFFRDDAKGKFWVCNVFWRVTQQYVQNKYNVLSDYQLTRIVIKLLVESTVDSHIGMPLPESASLQKFHKVYNALSIDD